MFGVIGMWLLALPGAAPLVAVQIGGTSMLGHHTGPDISVPAPLAIFLTIVFIVIYLRLVAYFVQDLYQPERRVYGGDKTVWLFIIVFGSVLGILAYMLFGREN